MRAFIGSLLMFSLSACAAFGQDTAAGASLANDAVMGNGTVLIIQATYETTN